MAKVAPFSPDGRKEADSSQVESAAEMAKVAPSSNEEKKEDTSPDVKKKKHYIRLLLTILLVLTWVTMGLANSVLFTTIPEFRMQMNTSVEQISYALSLGAISGIIVAPFCLVADRFGAYSALVIGLCLFGTAVANISRPYCSKVVMFGVVELLSRLAWGIINAVGNSLVLELWGKDGNGPMHAIHFGYPIGAFLGPFLARPFLMTNTSDSNETEAVFYSFLYSRPYAVDKHEEITPEDLKIDILYAIVATILAVLALVFVVMQVLFSPKKAIGTGKKSYTWREILNPSHWAQGDGKFGVMITAYLILFLIFLRGSMKGIMNFIVTYAVDSDLGFTSQEAAVLSSAINAMGTLARGLGIVAARFFSIKVMLFAEIHGNLVVSMFLCIFGPYDRAALYVFCCFYGFVRDPIWPSILAWTDYYIILLSTIMGIESVIGSSIDVLQTSLQGYLYDNTVPESIFYTTFGYGVLMCLLSYVMYYTTWERKGRHMTDDVVSDVQKSDPEKSLEFKNSAFIDEFSGKNADNTAPNDGNTVPDGENTNSNDGIKTNYNDDNEVSKDKNDSIVVNGYKTEESNM